MFLFVNCRACDRLCEYLDWNFNISCSSTARPHSVMVAELHVKDAIPLYNSECRNTVNLDQTVLGNSNCLAGFIYFYLEDSCLYHLAISSPGSLFPLLLFPSRLIDLSYLYSTLLFLRRMGSLARLIIRVFPEGHE